MEKRRSENLSLLVKTAYPYKPPSELGVDLTGLTTQLFRLNVFTVKESGPVVWTSVPWFEPNVVFTQ